MFHATARSLPRPELLESFQPPRQDPLAIGLTIVAATALFGIIGWWIDSKLKTFPLLMTVGAVVGFAAALYRTILLIRNLDNSDKSDQRE
ncbi:AtpZ/AtpI family protein [bacterium]|nr:AtpZ/AtpI family protein [bacterium]